MPRHLRNTRSPRRWFVLAAAALIVTGLIAGGLLLTGQQPSTADLGKAGSAPHTGQTASPKPTGTARPPQAAASSSSFTTATFRPSRNPATGRVDTLDGLVPDYKLPPIEDGMVPVLTKIPTEQKVVFLTIDDGAVKRASDLKMLADNGIKASLFLANAFIQNNPDFFKLYTAAGNLVEDHSMTHNLGLASVGYEQQKAEICGMAEVEEKTFGRRPVFFRPPGGPYTNSMRQAAADCGLKAIVDWEAKANAGGMDYQVGHGLRPGDIVLMHFRPEFAADLNAFLTAQKAAGLKVVLLEDYLAVQ